MCKAHHIHTAQKTSHIALTVFFRGPTDMYCVTYVVYFEKGHCH